MSPAMLALRLGLAFVFLYAAVSSFLSPDDWIWYIPDWIPVIVSKEFMLLGHGISELVLGVWLLSGKKLYWVAILSALDLAVITLVNLEIMGIVFRDVGLFLMAVALAFLSKSPSKK